MKPDSFGAPSPHVCFSPLLLSQCYLWLNTITNKCRWSDRDHPIFSPSLQCLFCHSQHLTGANSNAVRCHYMSFCLWSECSLMLPNSLIRFDCPIVCSQIGRKMGCMLCGRPACLSNLLASFLAFYCSAGNAAPCLRLKVGCLGSNLPFATWTGGSSRINSSLEVAFRA